MSEKLGGSRQYFGIDFGTTCSATVGYSIMEGKLEIFPYGDEQGLPIPSVIAINKKTGEVYAGREAWKRKKSLSSSAEYECISSVKMFLDTDFHKEIAGKVWTTVEVAAELFKTLKEAAEKKNGSNIAKATVAIPVGFSPEKRRKLREAATLAGIKIESFVSEPTAAFFANFRELRSASLIAVFDWGGGTLDVSVLKNESGKVSELATGGIPVAGNDIDRKIAQRIHASLARKKNVKLSFEDMPPEAQDMLMVRSERAKCALSEEEAATVSILKYGELGSCREILDYNWFADIVAPEVEAAIKCLEDTIHSSGVGLANIDRILLVGGSSNLRPLRERLEKKYGDKLLAPEKTMWNVSEGAGLLAMSPGAYHANQTVGLILSDGSMLPLISPDERLAGYHKEFRLGVVDTSSSARFVFGGSPDIEQSPEKFRVMDVSAYGFLEEEIELKTFVSKDMVFTVLAKSNMRSSEFENIWEYPQLKCYYKLSKGGIPDGR